MDHPDPADPRVTVMDITVTLSQMAIANAINAINAVFALPTTQQQCVRRLHDLQDHITQLLNSLDG